MKHPEHGAIPLFNEENDMIFYLRIDFATVIFHCQASGKDSYPDVEF